MTFFIDTNMLFKPARLADLKRICGEVGHEVVTSSLVLAERLHQIARKGRDVDAANAGIEGLVHSIISFDEAEAVAVAQALAEALRARQAEVPEEQRDELTTDDCFQMLKRDRLIAALGKERVDTNGLGKSKKYPATVDIYLAGQVLARAKEGAIMVTGDSGEGSEFVALGVPTCTLEQAILCVKAEPRPASCP